MLTLYLEPRPKYSSQRGEPAALLPGYPCWKVNKRGRWICHVSELAGSKGHSEGGGGRRSLFIQAGWRGSFTVELEVLRQRAPYLSDRRSRATLISIASDLHRQTDRKLSAAASVDWKRSPSRDQSTKHLTN